MKPVPLWLLAWILTLGVVVMMATNVLIAQISGGAALLLASAVIAWRERT